MSTTSAPRRRPSKAAALRRRAELAAQTPATLRPELAAIVAHFDITRYGTSTQPVRPFLAEAIRLSNLTGEESTRKHCRHLTALAVFSDAPGLPLTVEAVLTTGNIDDYIRRGMAGESGDNRLERRRRLLWLASAANPGPSTPARLSPLGYTSIKPPYTPRERATIIRAARTQPNKRAGEQLAAVVALGFGAGADSVDMRQLWIRDLTGDERAGMLVEFHGTRPRIVPVRRVTEDLLRSTMQHRSPDELVIGSDVDRKNTVAAVLDSAALYNVPHIDPPRMRATWLADLMTDSIPVAVILKAAGLKSARTLVDVLPHLGPWWDLKDLPAGSVELLRGVAR